MKDRSGAENVMCRKNLGLVLSHGFFFDFSHIHHQGDIISTTLRHWSHRVTSLSIWFYLGKAGQAVNLHSNLLSQDE
jgi:hypothetical protein